MAEDQALVKSISSVVGADNITEDHDLIIDGIKPRLVVRPGCSDEVAACMSLCAEYNVTIVPAGRMTWLECGNPRTGAGVVLSLERMQRLISYSPPDVTATVEAGLTLSEFNSVTTRERQWLPLDPPRSCSSSLGAVAACNSSGALRLGFGTPRDYVIGMKLVHADGTKSKSGGKVAKNVAGYDMNKLYVGSFGTLAIITELTFKLRPLPDSSSTLLICANHRDSLFQLAKRVLASELQPASVVVTRRLSATADLKDDSLLVRFIDNQAAVEHQVEWVRRAIDNNYSMKVLSPDEAGSVWKYVADFDQRAISVRLSLPFSTTSGEFEKALLVRPDCVATADMGTGIIRLEFDDDADSAVDSINRLRAGATAAKGSLVIEKAPAEARRNAGAWGDIGSTAELMRTIKDRFDPQALLNPGLFVLGL